MEAIISIIPYLDSYEDLKNIRRSVGVSNKELFSRTNKLHFPIPYSAAKFVQQQEDIILFGDEPKDIAYKYKNFYFHHGFKCAEWLARSIESEFPTLTIHMKNFKVLGWRKAVELDGKNNCINVYSSIFYSDYIICALADIGVQNLKIVERGENDWLPISLRDCFYELPISLKSIIPENRTENYITNRISLWADLENVIIDLSEIQSEEIKLSTYIKLRKCKVDERGAQIIGL